MVASINPICLIVRTALLSIPSRVREGRQSPLPPLAREGRDGRVVALCASLGKTNF